MLKFRFDTSLESVANHAMEIELSKELRPPSDTPEFDVARVRSAFDFFVELGQRFGIQMRGYNDPSLTLLRALEPTLRSLIAESILDLAKVWTEILVDLDRSKVVGTGAPSGSEVSLDLLQSRALWRTLARHGFRVPSDLFASIGPSHIVEVYTAQSIQVFRSLSFFSVCSYTIEQIYSIPWYELYQRDEIANEQSLSLLARAQTGELRGIVNEERSVHSVYECLPGHSLRTRIQPATLCFFEDEGGQLSGYLHSFQILPGERSVL